MIMCHMQYQKLQTKQGKKVGTALDFSGVFGDNIAGRILKLENKARRLTRMQAQTIMNVVVSSARIGDKVTVKVCNCQAVDSQDRWADPEKAILATLKINRRNPIRFAVGPGGAELDLTNDISEYPGM